MKESKAIGSRGSWFAVVNGESLPCLHREWVMPGGRSYHDRYLRPHIKKDAELVDGLKLSNRAILTADTRIDPPFGSPTDQGPGFDRTGYIAIFSVDDIQFDQSGLRLNFTERLLNLK